jgi:hypothetical protein
VDDQEIDRLIYPPPPHYEDAQVKNDDLGGEISAYGTDVKYI